MTTAREIMTPGAECVGENETLEVAARRLPVIDGHDLVGMVSQADIARSLPDDQVGELVKLISF